MPIMASVSLLRHSLVASASKLLYLLLILLPIVVAQTCPSTGVSVGYNGNNFCLCNPGYFNSGGNFCSAKTPCPQMKQVTPLAQMNFASLSYSGAEGSNVVFRIDIEQYTPRIYTNLSIASCTNGQNGVCSSFYHYSSHSQRAVHMYTFD